MSNTDNTCIACGYIVPEGRQICLSCEKDFKEKTNLQKTEENEDGNFSQNEAVDRYR